MTQHATLTPERWRQFTLDQQLLMIANEMNRASKLLKPGDAALRQAVVMGSTLASFCVEAFSLDRLLTLTRPEIHERFRLFKRLTHFEEL